ncbi:phosphatase PAP2 family protein [Thermococcus sp.]|uniref:phosphatase PAP2 family protein n=1 Tax=Thermococcus sp. TaxID=35749 RepID=UPI002629AA84|nr:phosphatase PAP2 family protein [Thermococcus sp.]
MKPREGIFWTLTGFLALLLTAQVLNLLAGINESVDSSLPKGGLFTSLLTGTVGIATVLYLGAFFFLDVVKSGRLSRFTLNLTVAFVLSTLIVALLKALTDFPRPEEAPVGWGFLERIGNVSYFSFPSGHTARASLFAYFLSKRWKKLWPLWWSWALAIALTRLLLHVHWFSDVLFALLLGPWVGLLVELTEGLWLPGYRETIRRLGLGVLDVE